MDSLSSGPGAASGQPPRLRSTPPFCLSTREKRRGLWAITAASLFGLLYGLAFPEGWTFGVLTGLLIGTSIALLEVFLIGRRGGKWLRRQSMLVVIGWVTLVWSLIALVSVTLTRHWLGMDHALTLEWLLAPEVGAHFLFSLTMALLINFVLRISAFLGGSSLMALVLGRYQAPVDEKLAFMVLDINGSTKLTEALGDVATQRLISDFFFDLSEVIERFGGEVHRYIGDQMVVTWRYDRQPDFRHLLYCLDAIYRLSHRKSAHYERVYGAAPRFCVGLHGGHVLVSEVGDQKRELAYFGDTINVAAGLQQQCKALGTEVLISAALLELVMRPPSLTPCSLGPIGFKGKRNTVEAYSLAFNPEPVEAPVFRGSGASTAHLSPLSRVLDPRMPLKETCL